MRHFIQFCAINDERRDFRERADKRGEKQRKGVESENEGETEKMREREREREMFPQSHLFALSMNTDLNPFRAC